MLQQLVIFQHPLLPLRLITSVFIAFLVLGSAELMCLLSETEMVKNKMMNEKA